MSRNARPVRKTFSTHPQEQFKPNKATQEKNEFTIVIKRTN